MILLVSAQTKETYFSIIAVSGPPIIESLCVCITTMPLDKLRPILGVAIT